MPLAHKFCEFEYSPHFSYSCEYFHLPKSPFCAGLRLAIPAFAKIWHFANLVNLDEFGKFEFPTVFCLHWPFKSQFLKVYIAEIWISHTFLFYIAHFNANLSVIWTADSWILPIWWVWQVQQVWRVQNVQYSRKCCDSPDSPSILSKLPHLPNSFFEKNDIRLIKFPRVMSESGECSPVAKSSKI